MKRSTCTGKLEIEELLQYCLLKSDDISEAAYSLREHGVTPYLFLRKAIRHICDGEYDEAFRILDYTMKFRGIFFEAGSADDREFCLEMQLVRGMMLFLYSSFRDLPA
jgi:hypothetical protein